MVVPHALRADWLAEWTGELAHAAAEGNAGAVRLLRFFAGAIPDALWMRRNAPRAKRTALASPWACLALLGGLAAAAGCAAVLAAAPMVPAAGILPLFLSLLLTLISTPLAAGTGARPFRWWAFGLLKAGLIVATAYACAALCTQFRAWGGLHLLMVAGTLAFRWAILDQRRRCPSCLRRLSRPVTIREAPAGFLNWNGVEMVCVRGHGLLYTPDSPSDRFYAPRWSALDPSWRTLFDSAERGPNA